MLKENQVVKLRNGMYGVVVSFNGKPSHIVFKAYCNPITRYDKNLLNKNHDYDIMEIYDGSDIEQISSVFNKTYENNNLIWKRNG